MSTRATTPGSNTPSWYWQRIERIVPGGYLTKDTETGKALEDAGLLLPREPDHAAAKVAPSFADFVKRRAGELEQQYSLAHARRLPKRSPWNDKMLDMHLGWIHRTKSGPLRAIIQLLTHGDDAG